MNDRSSQSDPMHSDEPNDVAVTVDPVTHVATVEIRRGPNNFFDIGMFVRLADHFDELGSEGEARAIVLCSEDKHFCAGADFSSRPAHSTPTLPHVVGNQAAAAPLAVRSIRHTMRGDLADRVRAVLSHERAEQERLQGTKDWREGVRAVSERRAAAFTGQ